jgi:hypothetical protein
MKERAIQTLGYFPVGDGVFPHQKLLLQGLMDSVEVLIFLIIQIKCIFSCFAYYQILDVCYWEVINLLSVSVLSPACSANRYQKWALDPLKL